MALYKQNFDDRDEQYSTLKGQQRRPITQETVDNFRQFLEEMQRKHGKQITNSADIVHQMREERTKELEQR